MAEYIDKEQVVQYLYNQAEALDEAGGSFMAAVHAQGWGDAIKKWPAADVRPALHAHWAHKRLINTADCSNCGKPHESGFVTPQNCRNFNDWDGYCPKCGAIMDEEVKR